MSGLVRFSKRPLKVRRGIRLEAGPGVKSFPWIWVVLGGVAIAGALAMVLWRKKISDAASDAADTVSAVVSDAVSYALSSMDWITPDLAVAIVPPGWIAQAWSATFTNLVVQAAHLESAERYRARPYPTASDPTITACNIAVSDMTRWMGAEVPHQWRGIWQDVRAMAVWLRDSSNGWRGCSAQEAQDAANSGIPTVVVWDAPTRSHGHIALVVPQNSGDVGVQIAQAGASNFSHGPVTRGFGNNGPLEYFVRNA